MRIISGIARGTRLLAPKGSGTRPTPDMVREALFNIIADRVPGARFLDLFAGTGAVGLEALSRGAEFCFFSDKSPECVRIINHNAEAAKLNDKARVLRADAEKALSVCCNEYETFDIIYLDPPYEQGFDKTCLKIIDKTGLLAPDGIIIAERSLNDKDLEDLAGLRIYDRRKYGGTELVFIKITEE